MLDYSIERNFWRGGLTRVAGVDEAGRGPLAGPVVAAAVVFPPELWIDGVDDSKALTHGEREELFGAITRCALGIGVGIVPPSVIDEVNILRATFLAMEEAIGRIAPPPEHIIVDGPRSCASVIPATPLVGGDARCFAVAAASIIAKVTRDRLMVGYDEAYPGYGFARHKGYGTPAHLEALRRNGPSPIHRKSFRMPGRDGAV